VALLRIDVSKERIAIIISVTRIVELGTTLAVSTSRSTLRRNASVLTTATRRHAPEDGILDYHLVCGPVWVMNLASHIKVGAGSGENIWMEE
jgi:hypothetical protein